ncbi:exocyst subunit exo70 family protein G1 [Actinidia rufa]|uniref:Exocyst subunit Exo70 family protein n=1 Tax=Actinidia rufa TaxID=165716 RepID=A0A7J0DT84_9ERIC|nr:exocyst subunit exo70 family protein G1 [Actinidia rufa]
MGSVNNNGIENLASARKSLKNSLAKLKAIGLAAEKAGPILDEINQRLPSLEAAVRPIRAQREALVAVGGHINRAVVPAAAVLKVFDAIHGLEKSLSDPQLDLLGYLSVLKRLEEALRFLGDNCGMAIQWLDDIVEYLEDNKVADDRSQWKCYRASLQALNLDYLEISVSEFNDVQSIEGYIAQWGKHLEFAVKHLFEAEYKLCNDVFERLGLDVWMGCFAKIAAQAGILAFLQFGKTVTESKKDPIKLLKLLDIFASLNKLRLDFNRLFGGTACAEIQNLTRDLIKRVIEGACEIFWELLVQVELQRQTPLHQMAVFQDWEGLILFSGGRATARDLVKKRLKAFNEAFDDIYKKQSSWVVVEKDLREKTCQLIVQAIVPVYRSYMQNYGPLVEQEASASKYAKYTAQSMEKMLSSLFQPKPVKSGSFKVRQLSGKFSNGATNQYCSSPTVT